MNSPINSFRLDLFGFARPPARQLEDAAIFGFLRILNGLGDLLPSIEDEWPATRAEDHVVHLHQAARRRFLRAMGHQNLPAVGGGPAELAVVVAVRPGVDPPAKPGGAEIVCQLAINRLALGEILRY